MQVRKLDPARKRDVRQFVEFPFRLYAGCRLWVPPLVSAAQDILNRRRHPFYRHSEAEFFVVESEGQVLGRMAMLENRNFNRYQKRRAAFFGYFEMVDDIAVARMLLALAARWARSRNLSEIIGPRGVMGVDGSVLVEGFDHRPALGISYNYPYYDSFIQDSGFRKDADYLSGYRRADLCLPERVLRIAEQVKKRRGFRVKSFRSKREITRWIPRLLAVHHQAMGQLHSFYPPTPAETAQVTDTLLTIVEPKYIKLVLHGEEIAGFMLAYPDLSAGLQRAGGRLWPWGWFHLLRERRRATWINVNAIGLLPAYRGLGANALLYSELYRAAQGSKLEHIDMVQIDERNAASRADLEALGVQWYKRHRHYRLALEDKVETDDGSL